MSAGHLVAALAAALLAAGALGRRRRLGRERTALALAAALALAVYASGVLPEPPDPEDAIEDVATALGPWTYVLVGGMAFLETGAFVGLVAPGEFTVIVGGVIAGQGEIDVVPLIGVVWLCAALGDTTSFVVGRKLGRGFVLRHGPRLGITRDRLEQIERYFARHGGKTILIGRFIGLVRSVAPFIAGSSGMRYGRFLPYSVLGTGLWGSGFCVLGFVFYRSFARVADVAGRATVAFGLVVATVVLAVYAYRRLRREEERRRLARWLERQGERPALRPLAAVARPVWRGALRPAWRVAGPRLRFMVQRLTPGQLGIEFTTALATTGVGLYVFGLYTAALADDPGLTPADRQVLDVARELRTDRAVDAVKVVTDLGAFPVVGALVVLAALLLALRRRPVELLALVAGFVLVYVGVQLTKAGIDRPRPFPELAETAGSSFPSGHAAYSTAYVALAVVAARVLPGLVGRASVLLASLAVAAAIGLSRLYLNVHYWSDVASGWALGFGVFGACAAVALLVAHIRHNEPAPARRADEPAAADSE